MLFQSSCRPIDETAPLVSPCDGRVLHFGLVDPETGIIEQVKGTPGLHDNLKAGLQGVMCTKKSSELLSGSIFIKDSGTVDLLSFEQTCDRVFQ